MTPRWRNCSLAHLAPIGPAPLGSKTAAKNRLSPLNLTEFEQTDIVLPSIQKANVRFQTPCSGLCVDRESSVPHHIQIVFPHGFPPVGSLYLSLQLVVMLLWVFCTHTQGTTKGDASSMSRPDYKRSVQNTLSVASFFTAIKPSDIMNLLNPTLHSMGNYLSSILFIFFDLPI